VQRDMRGREAHLVARGTVVDEAADRAGGADEELRALAVGVRAARTRGRLLRRPRRARAGGDRHRRGLGDPQPLRGLRGRDDRRALRVRPPRDDPGGRAHRRRRARRHGLRPPARGRDRRPPPACTRTSSRRAAA
jgi:hypothetical protein